MQSAPCGALSQVRRTICLRQCSSGMAEPRITLPHWPVSVVSDILHGSTQAWIAGGAVRDLILGHQPRDWDFVVAASGLTVARAVADRLDGAYYPLDHERQTGRAIVTDPASGLRVILDFASLRADSIIEDLQTRDFTINAMAVSLEGDLIDPVGGATDVSLRQLRMVAPDCFTTDSVRLIRAVRLSAQFGMTITEETRSRIVVEAPAIAATAAERVRAELMALLALTTASEGLRLLVDLGIVQHMVPELVTPTPSGPVVDNTSLAAVEVLAALDAYLANNGHEGSAVAAPLISAVDALSDGAREGLRAYLSCNVGAEMTRDVLIRWAALYARKGASRSGTGEGLCSQIAHRMAELRFSNSAIEFATALMRSQQTFARVAATGTLSETGTVLDVEARRVIHRFFKEAHEAGVGAVVLALARASVTAQPPSPSTLWDAQVSCAHALIEGYLCRYTEVVAPKPLLRGQDLLALGVPPGPSVGKATALLAEAQAAGEVTSAAQARTFVLQWLEQEENRTAGKVV